MIAALFFTLRRDDTAKTVGVRRVFPKPISTIGIRVKYTFIVRLLEKINYIIGINTNVMKIMISDVLMRILGLN